MPLPKEYGNVEQAIAFGILSKVFSVNNIIILKIDTVSAGGLPTIILLDASQYNHKDIPNVVRKIQKLESSNLKNFTSKKSDKFSFRRYDELPFWQRALLKLRWSRFTISNTCVSQELAVKMRDKINTTKKKSSACYEGLPNVSLIGFCDLLVNFDLDEKTSIDNLTAFSPNIDNWIQWVNEATREGKIDQQLSNNILKSSYSLRKYVKILFKNCSNSDDMLESTDCKNFQFIIDNFNSLKDHLAKVTSPPSISTSALSGTRESSVMQNVKFQKFYSEISQFNGNKCDEVINHLNVIKMQVETYQKLREPQAASESGIPVQF